MMGRAPTRDAPMGEGEIEGLNVTGAQEGRCYRERGRRGMMLEVEGWFPNRPYEGQSLRGNSGRGLG